MQIKKGDDVSDRDSREREEEREREGRRIDVAAAESVWLVRVTSIEREEEKKDGREQGTRGKVTLGARWAGLIRYFQ